MDDGLPKLLVDWSVVVGSALSLLALVTALYALWKSKRDIANERRRQHELDLIRDISDLLNQNETIRWQAWGVGNNIMMLASSDDFPMTRVALRLDSVSDRQVQNFDREFRKYVESSFEGIKGRSRDIESVDDAINSSDIRWEFIAASPKGPGSSIIHREVREAIENRVK